MDHKGSAERLVRRRLIEAVCASVVLAAAACGPVTDPTRLAPPRTEALSIETSRGSRALVEMRTTASVRAETVQPGAAAVWASLPLVFEALGIATTTVDLDRFVMGNTGFAARQIDDTRIGRFVDCGVTSGRPRADQHQVTLYAMVQLATAADGGTLVSTFVDAYAAPRGVSGGSVHCVTTGRLERRVIELIDELAGG